MFWLYSLLILFGFLPLAIVLYKIKKTKRLAAGGSKVLATVTNAPSRIDANLDTVQIEYTVKETGQMISNSIIVAGSPYKKGDQLPLFYDKVNPYNIQLDAGKNFIFLIVFSLLIAAIFIIACFII